MMEFVVLTLSFTVAILLASALALFIIMQPKVMKAYMKTTFKTMKEMEEIFYEEQLKDL